jgi:hypothetical protein
MGIMDGNGYAHHCANQNAEQYPGQADAAGCLLQHQVKHDRNHRRGAHRMAAQALKIQQSYPYAPPEKSDFGCRHHAQPGGKKRAPPACHAPRASRQQPRHDRQADREQHETAAENRECGPGDHVNFRLPGAT